MNLKASFRVHTLRFAGFSPILIYRDWIIRPAIFRTLFFLKLGLITTYQFRCASLRNWCFTIKIIEPVSRTINNLVLTFVIIITYFCFMKKISRKQRDPADDLLSKDKPRRENVWCAKNGYFIDLDACRARSLQQKHCRRCYASLIQVPLPF